MAELKEIYLAGGCFWGTEKYLSEINGVVKTDVGYANGTTANPTYQEVCSQNTGHAETVRLFYDPMQVRLEFILELYYDVIDPISKNRQGGDVGPQYRTGIYYIDPQDEPIIRESLAKLQTKFDSPLAIEVHSLSNYYSAEKYHQQYLDKNPTGYCHISKSKFIDARDAVDPLL